MTRTRPPVMQILPPRRVASPAEQNLLDNPDTPSYRWQSWLTALRCFLGGESSILGGVASCFPQEIDSMAHRMWVFAAVVLSLAASGSFGADPAASANPDVKALAATIDRLIAAR